MKCIYGTIFQYNYATIHYYLTNRYDVMAECWSEARGERPNFTSLVDTLSNILERESDYLQLTDYLTV